jgi:hypothetical protein
VSRSQIIGGTDNLLKFGAGYGRHKQKALLLVSDYTCSNYGGH